MDPSRFIAHRGEMGRYPENTLCALQAAIDAGAQYLEFDVQFSRDRIPVVFHDLALARTTGRPGTILDYPAEALTRIPVDGVPQPGLAASQGTTIPTLERVVAQLNDTPLVSAFVELKRHGIERFGVRACVDAVVAALRGACFPWTLISFRLDAVRDARARHGLATGWVLREYSDASRRIAEALGPDYLFCNINRLPAAGPFWPGPWRWAIYDIKTREHARSLLAQGADLIETCCITDMLQARRPQRGPHCGA
jgi:glycerophosphoryl diester phosphodiesterase